MLTVRKVETLPPGVYCDGGNLYLWVRPTARSWIFRYKAPGAKKRRNMGLGSALTVTLARARAKAHAARVQLDENIDPLEARRGERAEQARVQEVEHPRVPTLADCAKSYFTERHKGTTQKHRRSSIVMLEQHAFPIIGNKRVNVPKYPHCLEVIRLIWDTHHVTAKRVLRLLRETFQESIRKGYRSDDPTIGIENALARPSAVHTVKHRAALDVDLIPAFIAKLRASTDIKYRLTEFTVLTGAREAMARKVRWDQLDIANRVWTCPGSDMKSKRVFRVPLTARAMAIIEAMEPMRCNDYVFPSPYPGCAFLSSQTQLRVTKKVTGLDVTAHGTARAAFATWAQAQGIEAERLAQLSLDHRVHTATEAAYARSDLLEERRKLMQAWDDYCSSSR